jgi:ATP-dependent Clp protease protease subunit
LPFWNFVKNEDNDEEIELKIDGDIVMEDDFWSMLFGSENVTPKGFMSELSQYKGKNINVWINSYGGDVYAASRIYTSLKQHKGKVTVKVDGVAISAASVIAMAGDEILMSPTSIMMIHNPWGNFQGEAEDLRHGADVLDEVKQTIINAYQLKSNKSRAKISQMMDEETWMSAKKAVSEGFADGMLYSKGKKDDEGDEEQQDEEGALENSFMFSRISIQNKATNSIKRLLDEYNKKLNKIETEKLEALNKVKQEQKIKSLKAKLALECEL